MTRSCSSIVELHCVCGGLENSAQYMQKSAMLHLLLSHHPLLVHWMPKILTTNNPIHPFSLLPKATCTLQPRLGMSNNVYYFHMRVACNQCRQDSHSLVNQNSHYRTTEWDQGLDPHRMADGGHPRVAQPGAKQPETALFSPNGHGPPWVYTYFQRH